MPTRLMQNHLTQGHLSSDEAFLPLHQTYATLPRHKPFVGKGTVEKGAPIVRLRLLHLQQ